MSDERLFQVAFDLPEEGPQWPPVGSERLWAAKTPVNLQLALRNVPFYAKGVAYGDIIEVSLDDERREIVFERLVSESGHSTLQLLVKRPEALAGVERLLDEFAATWEKALEDTYLAVDVGPECDYSRLRPRLIEARDRGDIGLREGAISTRHQAQLPSFP